MIVELFKKYTFCLPATDLLNVDVADVLLNVTNLQLVTVVLISQRKVKKKTAKLAKQDAMKEMMHFKTTDFVGY